MKILNLIIKIACLYVVAMICGFFIFSILMYSDIISNVDTLFYRGIVLSLVSLLLLAALLAIAAQRYPVVDLPSAVGAMALSLGFNLCFLVLLPVTIDRSVTVFLLARLDAQERPISEQELQSIFEAEYLGQLQQIHRRVDEQSVTGNVRVTDEGVAITENGRQFVALSRKIGHIFGADERFTSPQRQ